MTLSVQDIVVRLGGATVLNKVGVSIADGQMLAVIGPNGSGKSTLVRTLAGVLRPQEGAVSIDGRRLHALSGRARAQTIGFLPQSADAPSLITVQEHVGLGRFARRSRFARWSADDAHVTQSSMATCEVEHLAHRRMESLSGGERQRVRLATLLAQNPKMLLLDEPLTGLDIEHQLGLLHLLRQLNRDGSHTVVCVLHDLDLTLRYFDRVVVVDGGTIAADGPPHKVLCPALFERVFGVDGRIGCESSGEPVVVCRRCVGEVPRPVEIVVRPSTPLRTRSRVPASKESPA
ncbi:MAG: ABC transporter ATP-binding protein [Planctomycetota bacterium]